MGVISAFLEDLFPWALRAPCSLKAVSQGWALEADIPPLVLVPACMKKRRPQQSSPYIIFVLDFKTHSYTQGMDLKILSF